MVDQDSVNELCTALAIQPAPPHPLLPDEVTFQSPESGLSTVLQNKLATTLVVPISTIEYDPAAADPEIVGRLSATLAAPWGKLLEPVLVSKLSVPTNGKQWLLRRGVDRVVT